MTPRTGRRITINDVDISDASFQVDSIDLGGLSAYQPPGADRGDYYRVVELLHQLGQRPPDPRIVVISGDPPSKGRPRFDPRSGRTYTDARTRKEEARLAWQMRPLGSHSGPVVVAVLAYRQTKRRVDVDNLAKAALDAATIAGVWKDDSQITALAVVRLLDRDQPRLVLGVSPLTDQEELDV